MEWDDDFIDLQCLINPALPQVVLDRVLTIILHSSPSLTFSHPTLSQYFIDILFYIFIAGQCTFLSEDLCSLVEL